MGGRGGGWAQPVQEHPANAAFHSDDYHDTMHMYSLSEETTQISEMQHEIDSLRRSLNQLALLQA